MLCISATTGGAARAVIDCDAGDISDDCDIELAVPTSWRDPRDLGLVAWMRTFIRTEVLIAVRGCLAETSLVFEVGKRGSLLRVQVELELVSGFVGTFT